MSPSDSRTPHAQPRRYRAGENIEDYCRACQVDRLHAIVAAGADGQPIRVICGFCRSEHNYRGGPRTGAIARVRGTAPTTRLGHRDGGAGTGDARGTRESGTAGRSPAPKAPIFKDTSAPPPADPWPALTARRERFAQMPVAPAPRPDPLPEPRPDRRLEQRMEALSHLTPEEGQDADSAPEDVSDRLPERLPEPSSSSSDPLFERIIEQLAALSPDTSMDLEQLLRRIIREETGLTPVAPAEKWRGGELVLRPGRPGIAEKSWPIDTFFHKVVMIRNRLRTLEQQLNASDLPDDVKVKLQGYVTGCYGSLTSFNVLFADEEDHFSGANSD